MADFGHDRSPEAERTRIQSLERRVAKLWQGELDPRVTAAVDQATMASAELVCIFSSRLIDVILRVEALERDLGG